MYSLTKFTPEQIQKFITSQRNKLFSYAEVGASQVAPPAGYTIDHKGRILLTVSAICLIIGMGFTYL